MKTTLALICCMLSFAGFSQIDVVRISQVYGGGGNAGATYNQDFVEIYNVSGTDVNIGNWSVQYASATGPGGNGNWDVAVIPSGTILPVGKYFLVGLATGTSGAALPTPDVINTTIDLSATAGKVALVKNSTPLNGAMACADTIIADVIGYGTTASCFRAGSASTSGINSTRSLQRASNGCLNFFDNANDFSLADVTPRNGASPGWSCYGPTIMVTVQGGALFTTPGVASAPQIINLAAFGLTGGPGNIAVDAGSPNFEVSLSSSSGFARSIAIPFSSFSLDSTPTPVYVRISSGAALGPVNTTVTFSGGGVSASVSMNGNVLSGTPTTQAAAILFSNITGTSLAASWTNGNGANRLVVIRQTTAAAALPVNGTNYTAATNIGTAGITGPGNFVVFNGNGAGPVIITGLTPGTSYTVNVYEFSGSGGSSGYLTTSAAGNPANVITTGSSPNLVRANFTSVYTPLYMSNGNIPTMFYATVSNLSPNSTYKYYTQAAVSADLGTASTGAGSSILIQHLTSQAIYYYSTNPSINTYGGFGEFTTNDTGSFSGSFGFVNNADARFTAGNTIIPSIALTGELSNTVLYRLGLDQTITVLSFATTAGPNNGTLIQGGSSSTPGNLVALWDNTGATGRPLSITLVENRNFTPVDGTIPWHTDFAAGYDLTDGSWNTVIPNNNANGVRLIQQLEYASGGVMGCNQDANGTWPTGSVATSNPRGGVTPIKLSAADAPLNTGSCFGVPNLTQANFTATSASTPQYMATGNTQRLPTMFYARISNLAPYTTYRYYTQAAIGSDLGTASTGAGNSILIDYTSAGLIYTYSSSPSLNIAGGYGKFTTDGEGSFKGSFGFVNTGNARFTAGNDIIPAIALTVDIGSTAIYRLALNQTIRALAFGNTAGANEGSFIQGSSANVGRGSLVAIWDNTSATGRPLSITLVEKPSFSTGNGGTAWRAGFISGYDSTSGSWNTIIPNSNSNGARLIQAFELIVGNVQGCSADDDGTWPTGPIVTANPASGATPLVITTADAPLNQGSCYNILPIQLEYIKGQKTSSGNALNWKVNCLSNSIVMNVERAADTRNFKAIGALSATQARCSQPFDYIDPQPLKGNNYYRLKMIDIDGKIAYSPVVAIINGGKGIEFVGLYPSVVKDITSLSVSSAKAATIETRITDMSGRLLKSYRYAIPAGSSIIKIDCSNMASGIYQFTGVADDESSKTIRFVKQ